MAQAKRDENRIPTLLAVSSADGVTPVVLYADPTTHRLYVDLPSGSGTVTSVSVVSANGFAGTVATATTTPAITLSTTITGVLKGNGTAISAATAGTDYTTPTGTENLQNKTLDNTNTVTLKDTNFTLQDNADTTKQAVFELSALTTGSTRTYTFPNASATLAVTNVTQTFSGAQTFSATTGTFGSSTGAATYGYGSGATTNGTTKTLNIGTGGVSGSTTNITLGSSTSGATSTTTLYGSLNVGTPDPMTVHGAAITSQVQLNSDTQAVYESHTHSATAGAGAVYYGARSRGTTAAPTIVQSGDAVMQQYAVGYDGTDYEQLGYTAWEVDGTPGANDMPGRFIVAVTPDGGFTPAEALRISQDKSALFAGTISNGTSGVTTTGTIELGHASDTTLSRASAGVLAVEGVNVLTVAGGTLTGSITLGENTGIALDPAGSADGKWSGITIAGTSDYTQAFGDLVYLKASNSRWAATDADASATGGPVMVGMVVSAGTSGNACTILLQGQIRADAKFPALTIGAPVYLGETAGEIQVAIPTGADNVIRVVGFALTADEIYFNPSQDHQVTVA